MPSAATRLSIGGALKGLGVGLSNRAEREHQDEQAMLDRAHQIARDEADFKNENSQIVDTVADRSGNLSGLTRGGELRGLGIQVPLESDTSSDGMTAGEQRDWEAAVKGATTTDDFGNERVDYTKVYNALKARNPKLAEFALQIAGGPDQGIDPTDPAYADAMAQAEQDAKQRAPGVLSRLKPGDQTKEAFGGLTRSEWTRQRADEIYQLRRGGQPAKQGVPTAGTIETDDQGNRYEFLGGDPSKESNWRKVE